MDVELEGVVAETMASCGTDAFSGARAALGAPMRQRLDRAPDAGRVLGYVGSLDAAKRTGRVGLVELERTHSLAAMNLTDTIVRFVIGRDDQPRAGGAGTWRRGVTAGVFADLLRVSAYVGARP